MQERISGESGNFFGHEGNYGGNDKNNSLQSAVPDSLGDPQDKGFSRRLGLAMRKRRDQIFETGEGFIQLKEALPDRHRQKPQWKLISIKEAPSASFAPSGGSYLYSEKIIPETDREDKTQLFFPSMEGTLEHGAHEVLGAKSESFVFDDDPEERAAIQEESQRDGGDWDGKA